MTPTPEPPALRSDPDALAALVQATARHLQINEAFVEKDFWAIEVLLACAHGDQITVNGETMPVTAIFKGGTSLSRVHGLIDRFSEDIDVLIVFPVDTGPMPRRLSSAAIHGPIGFPRRRVWHRRSRGEVQLRGPRRNGPVAPTGPAPVVGSGRSAETRPPRGALRSTASRSSDRLVVP